MNTLASFTATDTLWMLVCACFVFFMQAGFTCYEAGLVQSKNVISVAIENIFNLTISIVLFSLVGFPMMFGETIFSADSSAEGCICIPADHVLRQFLSLYSQGLSLSAQNWRPLLVAGAVSAALIYPLFGRLAWGQSSQRKRLLAGKAGIPRLCRSQRSTYDCPVLSHWPDCWPWEAAAGSTPVNPIFLWPF